MSHFFDSKGLPAARSDPAAVSRGSIPDKIDKTLLDQLPSEEVRLHPGLRIVLHTNPMSPGADRFRYLRMCLRELAHAGKLKSLLITSPLPQDGKSTVTLNLATALAESGRRSVLVIEADLHRPTLVEQLGLEMWQGLSECLANGVNPISSVRRLDPLGWYLLPAGEPQENPTELLQTEALGKVIQRVSQHFDWVIIDSPPVMPLTDSLSLARQADATLLVARAGRTPDNTIERSIALLGRQRVLGILLNAVENLEKVYSGYNGYYGNYGYSQSRGQKLIGPLATQRKILVKPSVFDSKDT